MKSYGRADSAWDMNQFRGMLEDASEMSKRYNAPFCIGEDKDENLVVTPKAESGKVHIFACGVSPDARFWDNVEFRYYEIDDALPRVYDCLMHGIIEYGYLRFLSEGRIQLAEALRDARKLAEKHSAPFIIGLAKQKGGIMVAPMFERERFVDPLAGIVTAHGSWSVSDVYSHRIGAPRLIWGTPEDIEIFQKHDDSGLVFKLYDGIAYGKIQCGRFEAGNQRCIPVLESAIEDGAKMAQERGNGHSHVVLIDGTISVYSPWDSSDTDTKPIGSLEVEPRDFLDGNMLLRDKVSDAAKAAYEKFSKADSVSSS